MKVRKYQCPKYKSNDNHQYKKVWSWPYVEITHVKLVYKHAASELMMAQISRMDWPQYNLSYVEILETAKWDQRRRRRVGYTLSKRKTGWSQFVSVSGIVLSGRVVTSKPEGRNASEQQRTTSICYRQTHLCPIFSIKCHTQNKQPLEPQSAPRRASHYGWGCSEHVNNGRLLARWCSRLEWLNWHVLHKSVSYAFGFWNLTGGPDLHQAQPSGETDLPTWAHTAHFLHTRDWPTDSETSLTGQPQNHWFQEIKDTMK